MPRISGPSNHNHGSKAPNSIEKPKGRTAAPKAVKHFLEKTEEKLNKIYGNAISPRSKTNAEDRVRPHYKHNPANPTAQAKHSDETVEAYNRIREEYGL